jgi:precorrin-2 dehydrogenase / sirohydrochlorin ferrochelatase
MPYLPIFLDVTGRRCVVVGGGEIAARKVQSLLEAGADVLVVSPSLSEGLGQLASQGRIRHYQRGYAPGDLEGAALVYAATDDTKLHRRLHAEARERGIPINIADVPALCTFIAPAVLTRGPLKIAVSTEGASPAMAKRIIAHLERMFGPEYGLALEILRAARHHLKTNELNIHIRAKKLTALAASRIPEYLRKNDLDAVDEIIRREIGVGLETLGLTSIAVRAAVSAGEDRPAVR